MSCKGKGKPKPRRWAMIAVALIILAAATGAQAASSMTVTHHHTSLGQSVHVIKVACVAHTDGTFDSKTISEAIASAGLPKPYYQMAYRISNITAINPASGYPTVAATVTVTDSVTRKQLVGSTAGDTLTLSTSASGQAQLVIDRGGGQRLVTNPLTVAISDTGTAANMFDLYIEFAQSR